METTCKWVILARRAAFDKTGKPSLVALFNGYTHEKLTEPIPLFYVASLLHGPRNSTIECALRINGPAQYAYSFRFKAKLGSTGRAYTLSPMNGFVFPAYGDYEFSIGAADGPTCSEVLVLMPKVL